MGISNMIKQSHYDQNIIVAFIFLPKLQKLYGGGVFTIKTDNEATMAEEILHFVQ